MKSNRTKGERFAKLPLELLTHPAVTTLPHAAFRVLAIFAAGYKGNNNGLLACTDTWMRQFGMVSRDTLYTAIRELLGRGLIEVTRPGIKHRKVPTLYAITWQALNFRDAQILGRFSPATHAYRQWKAPERVKKKVPDRRKGATSAAAEIQSGGRASMGPTVGVQNQVFSPTSRTKNGSFQSDGREYSETLGGIQSSPISISNARASAFIPRDPALDDERLRRARKHLAADPNADLVKLQQMYQLTGEQIQQLSGE